MPIKSAVTLQKTVDFLNRLLVNDPYAANELFKYSVAASDWTTNHPSIQVVSPEVEYDYCSQCGHKHIKRPDNSICYRCESQNDQKQAIKRGFTNLGCLVVVALSAFIGLGLGIYNLYRR